MDNNVNESLGSKEPVDQKESALAQQNSAIIINQTKILNEIQGIRPCIQFDLLKKTATICLWVQIFGCMLVISAALIAFSLLVWKAL